MCLFRQKVKCSHSYNKYSRTNHTTSYEIEPITQFQEVPSTCPPNH